MYMSASAPEAPPLSVTTTGCFIRLFFWIAACIIRAIWSEAPPAPAATTISTGLLGSQAFAGAAASVIASVAPMATQDVDGVLQVIRFLPCAAVIPLIFLSLCAHCATIRPQFKRQDAP